MQEFSSMTVRDIAIAAPLTTRVFEEFKIDFCCGGRVPLIEACENAGIDPAIVLSKLGTVVEHTGFDESLRMDRRSQSELIDFIVSTHHAFTRDELARLEPLMDKVAGKHGDSHPELISIQGLFRKLADELLPHLMKEEHVLFPYIGQLERAQASRRSAPFPTFGTVQNPVRMMMSEHDAAGDLLRQIRALSSDYTAPAEACPSYLALYAGIEDLERDLHQHIHLENNILFPTAIATEIFLNSNKN